MAHLEIFDSSDDLFDMDTLELTCPICNEAFDISLDSINSKVECPHCKAIIEIESK